MSNTKGVSFDTALSIVDMAIAAFMISGSKISKATMKKIDRLDKSLHMLKASQKPVKVAAKKK